MLEKWTKPPSRYSEATLLGAMETAGKEIADDVLKQVMKDQGLGTPATRASIIETLISREYIIRDKKSLKPTDKGKLLIELLPSPLLKSAKLTAEWEQKLAEMAKGNYSLQAFMAEIKEKTAELVKEVVSANIAGAAQSVAKDKQTEQAGVEEGLVCPKCVIEHRNGRLVERTGQYGKFLCCSLGKDTCSYISNVPKNVKQRKALVEARCPNCQGATKLYLPKEKDKSPVLLCLNYNECKGIVRLEESKGTSNSSNNNATTKDNKQNNSTKPTIVQSVQPTQSTKPILVQPMQSTTIIIKNQNKIALRPGITNPKLWFPERPPEDEWRKIRQVVMERGNWTCASCGHRALKWMNAHHLTESNDNRVENLVPLCVACHAVYHVGRSLMNSIVEIWKSDISQVEIVQRTRQGVIDGLSLAEIKSQLPIKPGYYSPNSVNYANDLVEKMGNKPRAYLDEPLCAVFISLEQWQIETSVKVAVVENNFVATATQSKQTSTNQTPACKVCGKPTVKRSFKNKQGKEGYFFGCSAWKPNNQGCNAPPIWA